MTTMNSREVFFAHLAQTSPFPMALEITHAKGIDLFSSNGKIYKDLISGISVSNLGHGHPEIIQAVKEQSEKYMHLMVYGEYIQSPQTELANLMASLLPFPLDCFYFVNSGSEAVEGAIKLAKKYTGRHQVIAFQNAYHGSTTGALSLMGNETFKRPFRPLMPGVKHIRFNVEDDLKMIDDRTACVIIEPVQGEAGVILPNKEYLKKLRKKCDETGTLLVFDEIQTGMGRTGRLFYFENENVVPDILLSAKALGGGMPLGAFISSKKIMSCLSENPALCHITTFGGHPVCCAAAVASLKVMLRESLIENVRDKEQLFVELLNKLPGIKQIRSKGLLMAIDFGDAELVQKIIQKCIKNGLIVDWFLFNPGSIRIAPPLIIQENEIRDCCAIFAEAVKEG